MTLEKLLFSTVDETKPLVEILSNPMQGEGTPTLTPLHCQALGHFLRDLHDCHLKVAVVP